ncbi:PucR family transcriptional regulator [Gracilibacillus oryzae]|uniref:PucR family transcriptional regulator n=1 Tax=Gracilibacillus oryzae TaxID=1672701 RepID=A0A7C8L338_9BACI|nr:PucR family transcriptional regulator [Gracilibacillus oryzae]KAB8133097.1 PucR family transcriptional regulator [Gracilibacillus oryzae]
MELKDRGLSIQELLAMPQFKEAHVAAGAANLTNLIKRVNVMEVPDVENWVRPGEFLMTTGYPYRDTPEDFGQLIPKLAEKGVAGLGIKTKRFLEEIPPTVIEIAQQYNFPLIELQPDTTFSDIVRTVMEQVFYKESEHLNVLQERLQLITKLLLENKKLEHTLAELEKILSNPIALVDLSEESAHVQMASAAYKELFEQIDWQELAGQSEDRSGMIEIGGEIISVYMSPVPAKYTNNSWLILLEWETTTASIDVLTVDRVSSLIALELVNNEARKMVETQHLDQFISDWLQGRVKALPDIHIRAESCGYTLSYQGYYEALTIRWLGEQAHSLQLVNVMKRLKTSIEPNSLVSLVDGQIVLIIHGEELEDLDTNISRTYTAITSMPELAENNISICRGGAVTSPEKLCKSYEKAQSVKEISDFYGFQQAVLSIGDLGVYRLLYFLPDNKEIDHYVEHLLGPLLDYDHDNQTNLVETLDMYFRQNRNMKLTAKALFAHYNTVVYRMERIKTILQNDLDDSDIQLQLYLALKLVNLDNIKKSTGGLV